MVAHRYWDTCTFLGWLKQEPAKINQCDAGIQQAKAGKLMLVTSALTLAETLYLFKEGQQVSKADREKIRRFFENEYILLAELDRATAERAQDVVWDHGVKPKDAVHVATAAALRERLVIDQLDTFDEELWKLSGKVDGLVIGAPNLPEDLISNSAQFAADGASPSAAPASLEGEQPNEPSPQAP